MSQFNSDLKTHPRRPTELNFGFCLIQALPRLDAFSFNEMVSEIEGLRKLDHLHIAMDMRPNRFLSFQAIRYLVDLGIALKAAGGCFALVAPTEKTKRHFEIYGSLDSVFVARTTADLSAIGAARTPPLPLLEQVPDAGPSL
jgi:anti-anti-sigma regulatory factor